MSNEERVYHLKCEHCSILGNEKALHNIELVLFFLFWVLCVAYKSEDCFESCNAVFAASFFSVPNKSLCDQWRLCHRDCHKDQNIDIVLGYKVDIKSVCYKIQNMHVPTVKNCSCTKASSTFLLLTFQVTLGTSSINNFRCPCRYMFVIIINFIFYFACLFFTSSLQLRIKHEPIISIFLHSGAASCFHKIV